MPTDVGANYSIAFTPNDNVECWWSNKTSSGFTINITLTNWKGSIDYLASTVIKVTEQDISNLGPLDGYIFNE